MAKVYYVAAVFLVSLLAAVCDARPMITGSRRSAKWDRFVTERILNLRDTGTQGEWLSSVTSTSTQCTHTDAMANDHFGRRASGLLATPESQGNCGSCWAFASTHAYSDQLSITAEQQGDRISADYLTRCAKNDVTNGNGCCGGSLFAGVEYFREMGALSETCLPYTLKSYPSDIARIPDSIFDTDWFSNFYKRQYPLTCPSSCKDASTPSPTTLKLMGYDFIRTEEEVMIALEDGPVIAAMIVTPEFHTYLCGVYCSSKNVLTSRVNHAVEIVDYGTTSTGVKFWVVKNSWGDDWGEGGYFRIAREQNQLLVGISLKPLQLGTGSPSTAQNLEVSLCSADKVSNAEEDPLVQSVAEFGLEELNDNGVITCMNTSSAATLTFQSIINGTVQIAEGFWVTVAVETEVTGCKDELTAVVSMDVLVNVNGTFALIDYDYDSSSLAPVVSIAAMILMLAVAIFGM